jgi:hypothetical protein
METQSDRSFYQIAAAEKFPHSRQNIRGDGKWAVVSKCGRHWKILLFGTAELRDARFQKWFEDGCGPDCQDSQTSHFKFDLSL